MKRIILTGSTGLIGKEAVVPLKNAGFEIFCITSKNCNLFNHDAVSKLFKQIRPEYLLHFAWITGGDYLSSPINNDFFNASMHMLNCFQQNGGRRAVFSGTCFEYGFSEKKLSETDPLNPQTLYAQTKAELNKKASAFCRITDIDFSWGRIFYVYGHNEKSGRLTESIISSLSNNQKVVINYAQLIRDYMYSKDIAAAFVKLLESDITGNINICTGKGISLGNYAKKIAQKMNRTDLLEIYEKKTSQPLAIIGDNSILEKNVRYRIQYDYDKALNNILFHKED